MTKSISGRRICEENSVMLFIKAGYRMRSFRKIICATFISLTLVIISAIMVLRYAQQILTLDSGNVKADVIIVLGGGALDRPDRAVELFKAGAAPRILISGKGDAVERVRFLEGKGVPSAAIIQEDKSATTRENAKFSILVLREIKVHRAIVVTSWFHSRRALACFEHFAPDIQFYSCPSYCDYLPESWSQEHIRGYIGMEFVKLMGYWIGYGIRPYWL